MVVAVAVVVVVVAVVMVTVAMTNCDGRTRYFYNCSTGQNKRRFNCFVLNLLY